MLDRTTRATAGGALADIPTQTQGLKFQTKNESLEVATPAIPSNPTTRGFNRRCGLLRHGGPLPLPGRLPEQQAAVDLSMGVAASSYPFAGREGARTDICAAQHKPGTGQNRMDDVSGKRSFSADDQAQKTKKQQT